MSNVNIFSRRVYNEYYFIVVNQDISRHANNIKKIHLFILTAAISNFGFQSEFQFCVDNGAASLLVVYFGRCKIILFPLDSSSKN